MALTIKQLLDYSWMSQASYLEFTGARDVVDELTSSPINPDKIFAPTQATDFTAPATGYSFISYKPNETMSGFSATVFKSNADNTYTIEKMGSASKKWGQV